MVNLVSHDYCMATKYPQELARFREYLPKNQSRDVCWEWQGGIGGDGYGRFWFQGKNVAAHRASAILHFGDVPKDKFVLHHCDNPKCVNPDHLMIGTHRENVAQMVKRGRVLCGEKNGSSVMTENQVRDIVAKLAAGAQVRTLAREMGISRSAVRNIAKGHSWKHIPRPL